MRYGSETNVAEAKVALVGRMREWREAQRQKAGGMTQLTVWVPNRSAAFLREIFGRLADPGERGSDYRLVTSFWTGRRRAIRDRFPGFDFSAEIDLPFCGPHWHMRPAGGRITGSCETWIELTPNEADEVSHLCRDAVSSALCGWLRARDLHGKLRDHVGVALDTDFAHPDYPAGEGKSVIRPETDAAFEENEAKIAREVEREALQSRRHPTDDPTVVYYEGFHKIPSRCHAVHRRVGDRILFALGHIQYGGTSPTNMIEELAVEMWKRFYPKDRFDSIEWYDAWPVTYSLTDKFHMQRVVLAGNKGDRNGPVWAAVRDVPEDFIDEVRRVITPEAKTQTAA
jgi:hypothetical protein